MRKRTGIRLLLSAGLASGLAACWTPEWIPTGPSKPICWECPPDPPPPPAVGSIVLTPAVDTVEVGRGLLFGYVVRGLTGDSLATGCGYWTPPSAVCVSLTVSDSSVAGFLGEALVGKRNGVVTVRAVAGSASDSAHVTVIAPTSDFAGTRAGSGESCGLSSIGTAYCWGAVASPSGAAWTATSVPVRVGRGPLFTSLSVRGHFTTGVEYACGITPSGAAYCWGTNSAGQLGTGDTVTHWTPAPVVGGLAFTALAAGDRQTCGLAAVGTAYCWGGSSTTAVAVPGGLTFTSVGAGAVDACGLTVSGSVYCWPAPGSAPAKVSGGAAFTAISVGGNHVCGLTQAATAYCWGDNYRGQLGTGDTTSRAAPTAVTGALTFTSLSAGDEHTCGIGSGGRAYCWGWNSAGQLGTGDSLSTLMPVPVAGGLAFASLTTGMYHTCGVTTGQVTYCWGAAALVGDGSPATTAPFAISFDKRLLPTRVSGQP